MRRSSRVTPRGPTGVRSRLRCPPHPDASTDLRDRLRPAQVSPTERVSQCARERPRHRGKIERLHEQARVAQLPPPGPPPPRRLALERPECVEVAFGFEDSLDTIGAECANQLVFEEVSTGEETELLHRDPCRVCADARLFERTAKDRFLSRIAE